MMRSAALMSSEEQRTVRETAVHFGGLTSTAAGLTDGPRKGSLALKDTAAEATSKSHKKSSVRRKPKKLVALGMESPSRNARVAVPSTSEPSPEPVSDAAKYTFDLNISMCKIEVNCNPVRIYIRPI